MIFPSLNPIRWFRKLSSTDKFTFVVAIFTVVLAIATCIQVFAYIQTERAFLIVDDLKFRYGEPTVNPPFGLIMTIDNSGRNVAFVKDFNVTARLEAHESDLADDPKYLKITDIIAFTPITPGNNHKVTFSDKPPPNATNMFMTFGDKTTKYDQATYMANTIDDIRKGDIFLFIYGFIKYSNGYNILGLSESGYCLLYIPDNRRLATDSFESCKKPNYIYTR